MSWPREVRLDLSRWGGVEDRTDPVGRLLLDVAGMVAEFEADLIRAPTREAMAIARAKGHLRGGQPKLTRRQEAHSSGSTRRRHDVEGAR